MEWSIHAEDLIQCRIIVPLVVGKSLKIGPLPFVKEGVILPDLPPSSKTREARNEKGDLISPSGENQVACSYIDKFGRGSRIRTCDPLLPKQVR